MKYFLSAVFIIIFTVTSFCQTIDLQQQIEAIADPKQAMTGVVIIDEIGNIIVEVNADKHFPMQSVYKFHLALPVLSMVDRGRYTLNDKIYINKKELHPDTHSPLKDKYPDGNINLPLKEILRYSVSESDNNACDILFRIAGGTKQVHQYIQKIGITDTNIAFTEAEMHKNPDMQFKNTVTPLAAAQLLEQFHNADILSFNSRSFLWDIMANSPTGEKRIKALLPQNTKTAHKTGTGNIKDGILSACNDIGIILLPDGRYFILTVFITNSKESLDTCENMIAEIAKTAYDHFVSMSE